MDPNTNKLVLISISIPDLREIVYSTTMAALREHAQEDAGREPNFDKWFDLNELCDYLPDKPAKTTIYSNVHNKRIPYHKGKKKLRFLKSEIDAWLLTERRLTSSEVIAGASDYLHEKAIENS